jgi:hypothetical protein
LLVDTSGLSSTDATEGGAGESGVDANGDAFVPPIPPSSDGGDAGSDADAALTYSETVLADGPIAYYRFREVAGAGVTTAKDETGTHPGTYVATVQLGLAGPTAAMTSVRFTGGGHMSADSVAKLPAGSFASYTIELWVASEVPAGTSSSVLAFDNPAGGGGPNVFVDDATAKIRFANHGSTVDSTVALGSPFHHVVLTSPGGASMVNIYVDGAFDVSGANAFPAPDRGTFTIGTTFGAADGGGVYGNSFLGRIAEVAIYAKALTPAQIASHYAAR